MASGGLILVNQPEIGNMRYPEPSCIRVVGVLRESHDISVSGRRVGSARRRRKRRDRGDLGLTKA